MNEKLHQKKNKDQKLYLYNQTKNISLNYNNDIDLDLWQNQIACGFLGDKNFTKFEYDQENDFSYNQIGIMNQEISVLKEHRRIFSYFETLISKNIKIKIILPLSKALILEQSLQL